MSDIDDRTNTGPRIGQTAIRVSAGRWSEDETGIGRICVNACRMRLRKGRRTETVPIEDFLPVFTHEGTHARPVEDWSDEIERRMIDEELGQAIEGFTDALPGGYRVVFVLSDVEGLSNEETAQILGVTVPAVKSRLHRARLYLRERLGRYVQDGRAV